MSEPTPSAPPRDNGPRSSRRPRPGQRRWGGRRKKTGKWNGGAKQAEAGLSVTTQRSSVSTPNTPHRSWQRRGSGDATHKGPPRRTGSMKNLYGTRDESPASSTPVTPKPTTHQQRRHPASEPRRRPTRPPRPQWPGRPQRPVRELSDTLLSTTNHPYVAFPVVCAAAH